MVSHGQWGPFNLSTGEPYIGKWETCFSHPNFTAMDSHVPGSEGGNMYPSVCWSLDYGDMDGYYKDLQSFGFESLTYANYWEFGLLTERTDAQLDCDPHDPKRWSNGARVVGGTADWSTCVRPFRPTTCLSIFRLADLVWGGCLRRTRGKCDSNLYLREKMADAPFRRWACKAGKCTTDKGSVVPAGMMGAANMDAGGEQYRQHLLKSVEIVLQKLPHSAGLTFDGTGWFGGVNTLADDGRTFIEAYSTETGVPNLLVSAEESDQTPSVGPQVAAR